MTTITKTIAIFVNNDLYSSRQIEAVSAPACKEIIADILADLKYVKGVSPIGSSDKTNGLIINCEDSKCAYIADLLVLKVIELN